MYGLVDLPDHNAVVFLQDFQLEMFGNLPAELRVTANSGCVSEMCWCMWLESFSLIKSLRCSVDLSYVLLEVSPAYYLVFHAFSHVLYVFVYTVFATLHYPLILSVPAQSRQSGLWYLGLPQGSDELKIL